MPSPAEETASSTITFEVLPVTGSEKTLTVTFQKALSTGAATRAIASELGLGENVWMLRKTRSAEFLDDRAPIGEQISDPNEKVQITPKAHLGA